MISSAKDHATIKDSAIPFSQKHPPEGMMGYFPFDIDFGGV